MILEQIQKQDLIEKALKVRENAYAPYSHFHVGAALLCTDGTVFVGANVENASFGGTICAERSAILSAISAGKREFSAIAVLGAPGGQAPDKLCPPCGLCRQVLSEFCPPELPILLYDGKEITETTLGALLPLAFAFPESSHE